MEVSGQLHAPAALPPGKEPLIPTRWKAGWASEPLWTRWGIDKFPAPAGTRNPDHSAHPVSKLSEARLIIVVSYLVIIISAGSTSPKITHSQRPPMRGLGHVARMAEMRNANKMLVGEPKGKDQWNDIDINGRKMLE
jgi:hypothetical protein